MEKEVSPAVGLSITANLPGERNVVFQTHISVDEMLGDPRHAKSVVDALAYHADRLKARYRIEEVENEIRAQQGHRRNQLRMLEEAEHKLKNDLEGKDHAAGALMERQQKALEAEQAEWEKKGKAGSFKAAAGGQVFRLEGEMAKLKADKTQLRREFEITKGNIEVTLRQFDTIIAEMGEERDRLKAIEEG